jgi:hypothetical protein
VLEQITNESGRPSIRKIGTAKIGIAQYETQASRSISRLYRHATVQIDKPFEGLPASQVG